VVEPDRASSPGLRGFLPHLGRSLALVRRRLDEQEFLLDKRAVRCVEACVRLARLRRLRHRLEQIEGVWADRQTRHTSARLSMLGRMATKQVLGVLWILSGCSTKQKPKFGYGKPEPSTPARSLPFGCARARISRASTKLGSPPREGVRVSGCAHTPSWVYRRRLTGRLCYTISCSTAAPRTHCFGCHLWDASATQLPFSPKRCP
jgi:hypothetical protein